MTLSTGGITSWPFISQISTLMGYIMQGVDYILNSINCSNIVFYIIFFVIISKILTMPLIVKKSRASFLRLRSYEGIKQIGEKYKGKDLNKYKFKFQAERQLIQMKYGVLQNGCFTIVLQLLIVIGLYAVLVNLGAYVPRIGALPQEEIAKIYSFGNIYLRSAANIHSGTTLIFPAFAMITEFISLAVNAKLNKTKSSTKKTFDPSMIVSPIITFLFCFRFPLFIALYWGIQSLVSALINLILRAIFKQNGEEHYIDRELKKFNRDRAKRNLEPLKEMPIVL